MTLLVRVGFEMRYRCHQPNPMVLCLNVHHSRFASLREPDRIVSYPEVAQHGYHDLFGNWCTRLVAPAGLFTLTTDAWVRDSGAPDAYEPWAQQVPVEHLPDDALLYLLGSRYCETDLLYETAWQHFGNGPTGWGRVQGICDFVHQHITFGYEHARRTRTAWEAYRERRGVCRDYAHLAIALCRCLNIPARYCTGYLGDIRIAPVPGPMDFAGWFEAYLGEGWYTFDARNNSPRIGRVLMARGRDACDVALANTFGSNTLEHFRVWADEVAPGTPPTSP